MKEITLPGSSDRSTLKQHHIIAQTAVTERVNVALKNFFNASITRAEMLDPRVAELWQILAEVTLAGGKRLRPYILLLSYQSFSPDEQNIETILPVAVAQELLHVSFLMHDDIIDRDTMRHGQPNVIGIMQTQYAELNTQGSPTHYANAASLLGGNLLIGAAYRLVSESGVSDHQKLSIIKELNDAIDYVGAGEFLDMESELRPITETNALRIIDLKTAYYSFIIPLRCGAILAGASEEQLDHLKKFGAAIGAAFQLADDLLGVFGDEAVTGKSVLSDIREGKHTYLIEQTIARSSMAQQATIRAALGNRNLTLAGLETVKHIADTVGAKRAVVDKINELSKVATNILDVLSLPPDIRLVFIDLIHQAANRIA
jgi:geranylgeranyl diphosphate synthase type I